MIQTATMRVSARLLGFPQDVTEEAALNAAFDFADKNFVQYISHTFDGGDVVTVTFNNNVNVPRVQPAFLGGLIVLGVIVLAGGVTVAWTVSDITDAIESPSVKFLTVATIAVVALGFASQIWGK